jgi:hypothetical protein
MINHETHELHKRGILSLNAHSPFRVFSVFRGLTPLELHV